MKMRTRRFVFETLESRELLAADPIITEFMASNGTTLEDGDGATPDWIEIYNNGDQAVDLAGYRLTDNATDTNKWVFPNVVLGSGEFLTVFASGENTPDSAGNLHTNFSLSAGGEYLALVAPGGSRAVRIWSGRDGLPGADSGCLLRPGDGHDPDQRGHARQQLALPDSVE